MKGGIFLAEKYKKGYRRPKSEDIGKYLRKKMKEKKLQIKDVARKIRVENTLTPISVVEELVEKNSLPTSYSYFKGICDVLDVPDEVLDKWAKTDIAYLFTYWNTLKPDTHKIEDFGLIIRKHNRNYDRKEILTKTGFGEPAVCHAELLEQRVSFETFTRYAEFYGIDRFELLKEFEEETEEFENVKRLSDYINIGRTAVGYTYEQAAEVLGVDVEKYKRIEEGRVKYFLPDIINLSIYFGLSSQTLYKYVRNCKLNVSNHTYEFATKSGALKEGERRVVELSNILRRYRYITDKKYRVESHTLMTLMYLFLYAGESDEYRNEITYYLNHLREEGDLSRRFISDPQYKECETNFDYFNFIRNSNHYSCRQIGIDTNKSNAYVINVVKGNTGFVPGVVKEISEACDVSPIVLFEGYLKNDEPEIEEASIWSVIATINATLVWNLDGMTVETNTFADIARLIFDRKLSARQKYLEIKKLKFVND